MSLHTQKNHSLQPAAHICLSRRLSCPPMRDGTTRSLSLSLSPLHVTAAHRTSHYAQHSQEQYSTSHSQRSQEQYYTPHSQHSRPPLRAESAASEPQQAIKSSPGISESEVKRGDDTSSVQTVSLTVPTVDAGFFAKFSSRTSKSSNVDVDKSTANSSWHTSR